MVDRAALFSELVRWEVELWDAVDARLRDDCDLVLSRFQPMQVMAHRPLCRVQDIAAELAITVGGTSKLVDRIEAAGHCVRRPHPRDRRSSTVELTAAGRRLLARATTAYEDELERLLDGAVADRTLAQFARTLGRLRAATQDRTGTRSA